MAKKPKQDDKEQSKRFIDTARNLESDENGKAFERALDTVKTATHKPKKNQH